MAKLHFAGENSARPPLIHYQQHKVCCLATYLEAKAAARQSHHGRCPPGSPEILTSATGHRPSPIAAANNEGGLQNGREDNHTIGFVEQVLGDVVRNIENLFQHGAAVP